MALTDLLQNRFTRIIGTLAALAVPAGLGCEADEGSQIYPSSSQPTAQPCYSDSECNGERICINGYCQDAPNNSGSNTPRNLNNAYGVWRLVKEGNQVNTQPLFPALLIEKCNDGANVWGILEGLKSDGTCNYGDGGDFLINNGVFV